MGRFKYYKGWSPLVTIGSFEFLDLYVFFKYSIKILINDKMITMFFTIQNILIKKIV
jgi:hypothetical protein